MPYRNKLMQPWGAYFAIVGFVFLTLINGFSVFWPENWSASSFLTAYVGYVLKEKRIENFALLMVLMCRSAFRSFLASTSAIVSMLVTILGLTRQRPST
jgi:hypothetical protein